jgi:hypothetical protein
MMVVQVSPRVAELHRIWSAVAGAVTAGYVLLQLLGRRAGSTQDERQRKLPGDELVARPQIVTDHAVTLEVASADIWPWLAQLGWHLGGYYTPTWVDRLLFTDNWPSLDHLDPALVRDLHPGDIIPDSPPEPLRRRDADAPRSLVLHSTTHVPAGWRGASVSASTGPGLSTSSTGPVRGSRLHPGSRPGAAMVRLDLPPWFRLTRHGPRNVAASSGPAHATPRPSAGSVPG